MRTSFITFILIVITLISCDEIFDKDIAKDKVSIYAPADNASISSNTVLFKWNELDGAKFYRLQVVSPSLAAPSLVFADTIIATNQFNLTLTPGNYQWVVTAINNTAQTNSDTLNLTILQSSDLSKSTVANLYPQTALASAGATLSWDPITSADRYILVLWSPTWQTGVKIRTDTVTSAELTVASLTEGKYAFGVKAINETSATAYATANFIIDRTAPGTATLISPAEGFKIIGTTSVALSWNRASDNGSELHDSIYIADNTQFTNCIRERVNAQSITKTIAQTDTFYWYVRSCDAAGNVGANGTYRSFIRQ